MFLHLNTSGFVKGQNRKPHQFSLNALEQKGNTPVVRLYPKHKMHKGDIISIRKKVTYRYVTELYGFYMYTWPSAVLYLRDLFKTKPHSQSNIELVLCQGDYYLKWKFEKHSDCPHLNSQPPQHIYPAQIGATSLRELKMHICS